MDELIEAMEALERGGMRPERAFEILRKVHGTQRFMPKLSQEVWELSTYLAVIIGYKLNEDRIKTFQKEIAWNPK